MRSRRFYLPARSYSTASMPIPAASSAEYYSIRESKLYLCEDGKEPVEIFPGEYFGDRLCVRRCFDRQ